MTYTAALLIILSAMLHATWNLVIKRNHSSYVAYGLLGLLPYLIMTNIPFWTPVEISTLPWQFWVALAFAVFGDASLYGNLLFLTYKRMDMSIAYPIMRSLPILMTMGITSALHFGEPLTYKTCLGMVVVFIGCCIIPLSSKSTINFGKTDRKELLLNILLILLVALGTTTYTIADGQAQYYMAQVATEYSKTVRSLTYYSLRCLGMAIVIWTTILAVPAYRRDVIPSIKSHWKSYAFAGMCACATYMLVLLAMNWVTNVSYVQAFRQLGLPIGMAAAIIFLKERCTLNKAIGVFLILAGLALCMLFGVNE